MQITNSPLTNKLTRPGEKISPRGLVIHYTANFGKGANAQANRNYFQNISEKSRIASAHYCVDDHSVILCIPEDEMAYHVGAKRYNSEATARLGKYPNRTTIGIEMCVNSDGNWDKTYQNTVELAADILIRHGWFINDLWRHYDVTGKNCPAMMVEDLGKWDKFKLDVKAAYERKIKKEAVPVITAKEIFSDIKGNWAHDTILKAKELGLMNGYPDGTFKPDKPVTRAEMAVILVRLSQK